MTYMVITLGMIFAFVIGAYTGIKAVQMGLKFKTQVEKGMAPKMDKPVKEFFEKKEEQKISNNTQEMISDILGGE